MKVSLGNLMVVVIDTVAKHRAMIETQGDDQLK